MEKALGLAKQRQEEAREAREHEKLAHTQVRSQPAGQLLFRLMRLCFSVIALLTTPRMLLVLWISILSLAP